MVGVPSHECNVMLQEHYGPGFDLASYSAVTSANSVQRQMSERVPVKPGVVELLDFLRDRGLPLAIATSARPGQPPSATWAAPGCSTDFVALATRDDVEHPKPAPDLYLEAAKRLGVAPERCVAFEDSSIGIIAAHAAGMRAVMVARHPAADRGGPRPGASTSPRTCMRCCGV